MIAHRTPMVRIARDAIDVRESLSKWVSGTRATPPLRNFKCSRNRAAEKTRNKE